MPYSLHIKSKLIFLICLIVVSSFCFFNQAKADFVPKIYASRLEVSEINNNQIKGQFTIWNSENYYFTDLNYAIKLFKGAEFEDLVLIDTEVPNETFSVSPNKTITKSFTYQYPKNIVSGDYTLRVQIITARGSELGWNDQIVSLQGASKFLDILNISSRVLVGQEQAFPLTGINVSPQDDVAVFLKVKNPGDAITVVPNIKIFKRQFNMPLAQEYQDSPITFAKGETKDINLTMPKLDTPESYLAEVKFFQNNEQVSGIQYFRWVVKGEGGKILYIRADKDSYTAGEEMKITIDYVGPADFSVIKGAKLEVVVYDQNKNIVIKTSKDIDLNFDLISSNIVIPIKKDLFNPTVEAEITKDSRVLDDYKIALPTSSTKAQQMEKDQTKKEEFIKYMIYLLLAVIIISIIVFLFFRFKSFKR